MRIDHYMKFVTFVNKMNDRYPNLGKKYLPNLDIECLDIIFKLNCE